jgi:hypothetical protein
VIRTVLDRYRDGDPFGAALEERDLV